MSFFGTLYSKFIYNGTNTVNLEHSIINPTFIESAEIKHKSILTGFSTHVNKFHRAQFTVTMYLYKYDNPEETLETLLSYKGKLVTFYPFSDGEPIKNISGEEVKYYIKNIEPFYLMQPTTYDACNIEFEAEKYSDYLSTPTLFGYGYNYGLYYGYGL